MSNKKAPHDDLMCKDCRREFLGQLREIQEALDASGIKALPAVLLFQLADVTAGYPLPFTIKNDRLIFIESEGFTAADFMRQLCGLKKEVLS